MIKITPLRDVTEESFGKLFIRYYRELGCEDDCAHLLREYIIPDLKAGLIAVDYMEEDGQSAGFAIYQKDDVDNDWNFKEGWGDIREIYVVPDRRRQGLGKFLLFTAEMKLRESGADKCYALPAEGSEKFFEACGYKKTDAYNGELDCFVYEKTDLLNRCNK